MTSPSFLLRLGLIVIGVVLSAGTAPAQASGYGLHEKISLAGASSWDYLTADSDTRRLYVTHGDRVHVLDLNTLAPTGEITALAGVHGVAVAPELGRGFISNGKTSAITVFNLKTLAILGEWPAAGKKPDAILYDAATHQVCSFNGGSDNVTVFNATTGKLAGTLALGGAPEFAASEGTGRVFVNIEDKDETVRFDARSLAITARWPLAPAHTPSALAFDSLHHRLFVGCRSQQLVVLNSDTGAIVSSLPIGAGVDAVSYFPARSLVFVSNSDGTLNIFRQSDADHYSAVATLTTAPGARTHAVDVSTGRIFLSSAQFGPVPKSTPDQPRPRPAIVPGSFVVQVWTP